MWTLRYAKEVRNYIFDSYPYTEVIWQAIKALRDSENALPAVNLTEIEPNLYQWETHGHIVIYQRKIQQRELIIAALKPQE